MKMKLKEIIGKVDSKIKEHNAKQEERDKERMERLLKEEQEWKVKARIAEHKAKIASLEKKAHKDKPKSLFGF